MLPILGSRRKRASWVKPADWSPLLLENLVAWYDYSDASTLFQDTDRTTPVTEDSDPILGVTDKSGNGYHLEKPARAISDAIYKENQQNGLSAVYHANAGSGLYMTSSIKTVTDVLANITIARKMESMSNVLARAFIFLDEANTTTEYSFFPRYGTYVERWCDGQWQYFGQAPMPELNTPFHIRVRINGGGEKDEVFTNDTWYPADADLTTANEGLSHYGMGRGSFAGGMQGYGYEDIITGGMTDAEAALLDAYLDAKWAI